MLALTPLEAGYCIVVLVASYALRGSTGFGGFAAMPLLALVVSMIFEGFHPTTLTLAGAALAVGGNVLMLRRS